MAKEDIEELEANYGDMDPEESKLKKKLKLTWEDAAIAGQIENEKVKIILQFFKLTKTNIFFPNDNIAEFQKCSKQQFTCGSLVGHSISSSANKQQTLSFINVFMIPFIRDFREDFCDTFNIKLSMIAASVKVQEQQQMNRSKKFGKNKVNPNER